MQDVFDGRNACSPAFVLSGIYAGVGNPDEGIREKQMCCALDVLADHAGALRDQQVFRPLCFTISTYGEGYMEYMFGLPRVAPAKALVKKPAAAYVEKVYEEGDFGQLGIGT